jgi:UDP-glucose 4-epimerase
VKVLVTGASGFIGSHVADVLFARGHEVLNFDRAESPHHSAGELPTVIGEATDADALTAAMEGCDAVIHLAAMADVNHVQADPEGAELANSRVTLAVLEAARRAGVGRVVYGSTIWVYSDCPETEVCEETRLVPPGHLYTATKLAGELYCRSYAELYGVDYTILRFGIPYGPRARDATVLAAFTNKALGGEPLTVAGSGDQSRRFVYVEDLADGIVRGLDPTAVNRIYNLTGSETTTILEIAQRVKELVGEAEIVHTPARSGDFGGKEVSSERALSELGWEPQTPFREGARRYIEWKRAQVVEEPVAAEKPADPALVLAAAASTDAEQADPVHRGLRSRLPSPRRFVRVGATASVVTAIFFWSFASDDGLSLIAKAFPKARPVTAVHTEQPQVGMIVDVPAWMADDVAQELNRDGAAASIGLDGSADAGTLDAVRENGSDPVPRLKPGGPVRWIGTRGQLGKRARSLGLRGHFYYVAPGSGFTLGQDILGHTANASPVAGGVKPKMGGKLGYVERGDLVEISLKPGTEWRPWLHGLVGELRHRGLDTVSAAKLVSTSRADR